MDGCHKVMVRGNVLVAESLEGTILTHGGNNLAASPVLQNLGGG